MLTQNFLLMLKSFVRSKFFRRWFNAHTAALFFFSLSMTLLASPASAQALGGVQTLMQSILDTMNIIRVPALIIAIGLAAYKVISGGSTIQEVIPIVVAGILLGTAPEIAAMFIN
jgi:hypothetical protein